MFRVLSKAESIRSYIAEFMGSHLISGGFAEWLKARGHNESDIQELETLALRQLQKLASFPRPKPIKPVTFTVPKDMFLNLMSTTLRNDAQSAGSLQTGLGSLVLSKFGNSLTFTFSPEPLTMSESPDTSEE